MAAPLTLDNRLLLACARTEPDVQHIQALVERDPDWQAILRKTERWGLVPALQRTIGAQLPRNGCWTGLNRTVT